MKKGTFFLSSHISSSESIDLETKRDGQYSPIPINSQNSRTTSTTSVKPHQSPSISKATTPTFINKDYTDMPSKDYLDTSISSFFNF